MGECFVFFSCEPTNDCSKTRVRGSLCEEVVEEQRHRSASLWEYNNPSRRSKADIAVTCTGLAGAVIFVLFIRIGFTLSLNLNGEV